LRLLLVLVLVHGLAPEVAEIGEGIVHQLRTGHAAHSAEDRGDLGDQGPEHGCGSTQHRCACCAAQTLAPTAPLALREPAARPARHEPAPDRTPGPRAPERPFRPPIA
jgi:hypothetical protein